MFVIDMFIHKYWTSKYCRVGDTGDTHTVLFQNFIVGLNDYYNSATKRALKRKETRKYSSFLQYDRCGNMTYCLTTGFMAVVFNSLLMRFPQDISWSVDL